MFYTAEHVNRYAGGELDMEELIYFSESRLTLQFEMLLSEIHVADINCTESLTDIVLVTGPSSSGKTTFSDLLAEKLTEDGYNCTVLSLDNYYHDRAYLERKSIEAGRIPKDKLDLDFECIEAFDTDKFHRDMLSYLDGNEVQLPEYDFTTGTSHPGGKTLKPTKKDMIILEGIQALNPLLIDGIDFHRVFRVYICPFDHYMGSHHGETVSITPKHIRFMRRAIRDNAHRDSPLPVTMGMWSAVREGEEKYIKPMKKYADFFFNSSFEYEISYLKYKISELMETLDEDEMLRFKRIIAPENLKPFIGVPKLYIPRKSIFREFYQG